jgi:flagellar biosynthesis protein FliQ
MVCISLGAGVVAVIQAITQVQEQSLTHLARLVVLAATMYIGAHEAFMQIKLCFLDVLDLIVKM